MVSISKLIAVFLIVCPALYSQANLPSGTTASGTINYKTIAAPSTPASGRLLTWTDSTSKIFCGKNDAGNSACAVFPFTAASHQFVNSLSGGVFGTAQPAFTDISGTLGCAQLPVITGDVSNSSCAFTITALHLSPTPTLCSSGNYSRGIDANGNATGCTAATSGTVTGTGTSGQLAKWTSTTALGNADLTGDVTTSGTVATTVAKVDGVSYGTSPSTNTVPVVTGSNTVTYESVPVAAGGTGDSTLTSHGVLVGAGTSAIAITSAGTSGQCLISNGSSADPTYQSCGASGGGIGSIYPSLTVPVSSNFSWTNQLSTTVTDYANREDFVLPTNATDPNFRLWLNNAAYTNSVAAAFSCNAQGQGSYLDFGVFIRASGSGKFIFWGLDTASGTAGSLFRLRVITFNSVTSVSGVVKTVAAMPTSPLLFLQISESGGTRSYGVSVDGFQYSTVYTEATGTFITGNQAGIGMANFIGFDEPFSVFHYLQN